MEKQEYYVYAINYKISVDNPRVGTPPVAVNGVPAAVNPTSTVNNITDYVVAKDIIDAVHKMEVFAKEQPGFQKIEITSVTLSCNSKSVRM